MIFKAENTEIIIIINNSKSYLDIDWYITYIDIFKENLEDFLDFLRNFKEYLNIS